MTNPPEGVVPAGSPPPPTVNPKEAVKTPALLLMVAAGIGAVFCLLAMLLNILGTGLGAMVSEGGKEQAFNLLSGGFGIFMNIVGLGVAGFIVYGALQMKELKNHGMSMLAAVASVVPCISPCCVIGLPVGIWAIVVLSKPEVKAAFAKK